MFATYRAHQQASLQLPVDVRLMNVVSNGLTMLLILALLAVVAWWLAQQSGFALHAVRVHGDVSRNNVNTVRDHALPKLTGNFFTINLRDAQKAFESVPWVRHALVRRVWPNRLWVTLQEHRPAAAWQPLVDNSSEHNEEANALVNTFGEVFEANVGDVEDEKLPTFQGPANSADQMLDMYRRLTPLFARLEHRIEILMLSPRNSWRAQLDNGTQIQIGSGEADQVQARVEQFVNTLSVVLNHFQRPLEFADLRHREGYAVKLSGISTIIETADKTPR